jgi:hypothetical protein
MSLNAFSVGRDVTLNVVTPTGPVTFSLITKFTAKIDTTDKKIKGIDGLTRFLRFFDGWSGSFEIERQNSNADDYFAALEAAYYAGQTENTATITETITEPSGATTQYQYGGVLMKLEDAGEWSGDNTVKQKVSFVASRRIKLA